MRLKSEVWVQAFMRRCNVEGKYCTVASQGAAEAGAVFIIVNRLDGRFHLFGPAPARLLTRMATGVSLKSCRFPQPKRMSQRFWPAGRNLIRTCGLLKWKTATEPPDSCSRENMKSG